MKKIFLKWTGSASGLIEPIEDNTISNRFKLKMVNSEKNKKLKVQVVTPERILFDTEAYEVLVPSQKGQMGILPGHIPIISMLEPGILYLKNDEATPQEQWQVLAVSGGVVKVLKNNQVTVLADTAELPDEIDLARAEQAMHRAQQTLAESRGDRTTAMQAEIALQRSLIRMQLAKKFKKKFQ